MIRVGLLDTTIQGAPGSMLRYREQLQRAMGEFYPDDFQVNTEFLGSDNATIQRTPARLRMWRHHFHVWRLARRLDVSKYDLVHVLDGSFGYVASAVRTQNVITTVHDLIPRLQMDGKFPNAPPVGRGASFLIERALQGVQGSRLVIAVSHSTANDLRNLKYDPASEIQVVPHAVETELFNNAQSLESDLPRRPYLFHLGNNGFYKNRIGALEILNRINPSVQVDLVLAGPPPSDELRHRVAKYGLSDRVHFEVDPSQANVAMLYRHASALLFPSLYEGFGWPPLEAMSVGCPVVSSDAGSLPEVMGNSGVVAASGDYDAMALGCERIINDTDYRDSLVAAGFEQASRFTLKRLAKAMSSAYRIAHQQNR